MQDQYGRIHNNLRISVTDRCNFRCRYCMPADGLPWLDKKELLTFEEITHLVQIFVRLGVTKIRLTGGEPLLRRNLARLVSQLAAIPQIKDIALTTNGYLLAKQAEALVQAGLHRMNVSLDALDPSKFEQITLRNHYQQVWRGLETLERLKLHPIKINVVLMRGLNDDQIPRFVHLARSKPFIIRFIEYMPIGADSEWDRDRVMTSAEIIEQINLIGPELIPFSHDVHDPAERYRFSDGRGEIGFVSSVSKPFCDSCDRMRLTSDGKLRSCLFSLEETDLKEMLRSQVTDTKIEQAILAAVWNKPAGHQINQANFVKPNRTMSQIGG